MRKQLGLEAPERKTGLAAHDFATLVASANVLLTRSLKTDGTPTTPSRWLLRVKQLAKGLGIDEKLQARNDLLQWAQRIDEAKREKRAARPEPRPPVSVRPRKLSVTQVETWLRDPYAIYARHILRLRPLDPIDAEPGPRERGIAIHAALERFLNAFPDCFPGDALEQLMRFGKGKPLPRQARRPRRRRFGSHALSAPLVGSSIMRPSADETPSAHCLK